MRPQIFATVALFLLPVCLLLLTGCGQPTSVQADSKFAPGAFPPTLSDTEYHANNWNRGDCLTCHKDGVQDAPIMRHVSVPSLAKDAKCRTCHTFIPGSEPKPK